MVQMSVDNYNNQSNLEEQRRRKAENFRLNIQETYDDEYDYESYADGPSELNSYSGQDVKEQIERESKKSLKIKKKAEKKELKAKNKRNRRIFRWIWIISVIIVGAMVSVFMIIGMNDLLAINRTSSDTVKVKIPKDPTLEQVADLLKSNEIIDEPIYFKMFAKFTKSADDFSQGTYELRKNMDYQAILTNLEGSTNRTDTVSVTIIEGQNVLEIANTLYDDGAISDKDKFLELCNSNNFDNDFSFLKDINNSDERYYKLEGYLYPDKYDFYLNEDPESAIYKFLNNYESKINEKQEFSGYDNTYTVQKMIEESGTSYSLDEIMRIASIVQAEAANKDDMYYISSILHNRLSADSSMGVSNLGLDSTKYYPYRSESDVPNELGSDYVSNYDTYNKSGLPAGPICNPGMDAIKAAICPNDTNYYFFCHDKDGQAYYASTLYEHQANLRKIES